MTPQEEETLWRNRFIAVNMLRIGATLVVMLALAIWYSDLLVPGGSIVIGLPLALAGLVVSFWGPKWLARRWRTPPNP
jgi:protein-S-isoprenylcysteine O-methyltransferase Ste14